MEAFVEGLISNILLWLKPPKTIEVIDIIQILLITYGVYRMILWMKNTRAYTLLKGILTILAFVLIAYALKMEVIMWLIGNLSVIAVTALVIIFQPEIRKVLDQMGHSNVLRFFMSAGRNGKDAKRFSDHTITEIVRSCYEMGEARTGALIVFQIETSLVEYENTGIPVDGVISSQLLMNIFEHNTPLHDGAVIIRNDRISAATCYLPLSDNKDLSKKLGTRHRAGIGISELTDSLTIIVSEETGGVSYAEHGRLKTSVSQTELRQVLQAHQSIYPDKVKLLKGGSRNAD